MYSLQLLLLLLRSKEVNQLFAATATTHTHTFMLIHANIRTHTHAWTFKSVSHVFLLIFACVCFRLLLPVYLCEHLALALSHLGSLRHAGETNTNATPGSRQRLSGLSLGLTPTPFFYGAPSTPTLPDPLSPLSSLWYTLTSVAAVATIFASL